MTVARIAISLDAELARDIRDAAGRETTSAWLADAARRKLRAEGLLHAVHDWEADQGELTKVELRAERQKQAGRRRA